MKTALTNASGARSNKSYNQILELLDVAARQEAAAAEQLDFAAAIEGLLTCIANIRKHLEHAESEQGNTTVGRSRNAALKALDRDLTAKEAELTAQRDVAKATAPPKRKQGEGPKAGFEYEYSDIYVFDVSKAQPGDLANLKAPMAPQPRGMKTTAERVRFKKRDELFTSPHDVWVATADSTLDACSNLEIITRPLTADEWDSPEIEGDFDLLEAFLSSLEGQSLDVVLHPAQLGSGVRMRMPGARLIRKGRGSGQTQMTAATKARDFTTNEDQDKKLGVAARTEGRLPIEQWWLPGLDKRAISYLEDIVRTFQFPQFSGNNVKEAFSRGQGSESHVVLLKSPILQLLRTPRPKPSDDNATRWVTQMALLLGVKTDQEVAQPLVERTKTAAQKGWDLTATGFSYQEYLSRLLEGRDMVREWAAEAWGGGDIGLEQIDDEELDHGYVIEEHRSEFTTTKPGQYIDEVFKKLPAPRADSKKASNESADKGKGRDPRK